MTRKSKIAYLAGLVDGDGTISITIITRKDWNGYSFQPYISLGMTSRKLCKWAQHHFGGNLYGYESKREGHQKVYHWKLYGRQALVSLVKELLPYLLVKKEAALNILAYADLGKQPNQEGRLALAQKAQVINETNHRPEDDRILGKRESSAYLAGLIETDGSIGIRDNNGEAYNAYVTLDSTNAAMIKWVNGQFTGTTRSYEYENPACRDNNVWSFYGKKNTERFLLSIMPYLIGKKELANTVLQFVRLPPTWDKELRRQLFEKAASLQVRRATPTINTSNTLQEVKIESDLIGDYECALPVTVAA